MMDTVETLRRLTQTTTTESSAVQSPAGGDKCGKVLHWLADTFVTVRSTTWNIVSDVRNARRRISRSNTGSRNLIQKFIQDAVEN